MTPSLRLVLREAIDAEIAHFYDSATGDRILSAGRRFTAILAGERHDIVIPRGLPERLLGAARLGRRLLRLDKSNAVLNHARDGIVIVYRGAIYFYCLRRRRLALAGRLAQCRNVLHGGVAVTAQGIYLGEYGANPRRDAVPLWRSTDDGRSFAVAFTFPAGSIKHIHGVLADPYTSSLWTPTGDFDGECHVVEARDPAFTDLVWHGDGSQDWRFVSVFFERDHLLWGMDSQLQTSRLQQFDRRTARLSARRAFPGPVWYSKRFEDGKAIIQTTAEIGAGVRDRKAHLFASCDLRDWREVMSFDKDPWPMRYFKFGVVAFADGPQLSTDFLMFGEALSGFDGKIFRAGLVES